MTCTHEFPLPAYEGIERDPAESNHLVGPDDLGVEDGVWTCPHEAADGAKKCVFHLAPEDRPEGTDITAEFLRQVEAANNREDRQERRRHRQFIDAHFDQFTPKSTVVGGTEHGYIDCRHARFEEVDCERAEFDQRIRFANATFGRPESDEDSTAEIRFRRAIFRYSAGFSRATFHGQLNFRGARFHDWAGLRWITCEEHADFEWAIFHDMISARGAQFLGGASFRAVEIHGWGQFIDTTFGAESNFELTQFGDDADFIEAEFDAPITFAEAEFDRRFDLSDSHIRAPLTVTEARVERDLVLSAATLDATVTFDDCALEAMVEATPARLTEPLVFEDSTLEEVSIEPTHETGTERSFVAFTGSHLISGRLNQPERGTTTYDLAEATLGDVKFLGSVGSELYHYLQLYRTRFDRFDFNDDDALDADAVEHDIHVLSDEARQAIPAEYRREFSPTDRWVTYLHAKNGADAAGDNVGAGAFFYREMVHRRKAHLARAFTDEKRDLGKRFHDFTRWVRSLVLSGVTGYGEKPDRVIYTSLVVIVGFAPFYSLTVVEAADTSGLEYLALSLQSYVTFILGQPPGEFTLAGEILSAFEAFIGAFLVALFVFTLTRRVNR